MRPENPSQGRLNTTMMGVIKAVLDFYDIDSSEAWAFGGSGHAFLINIHEQICPSGPYCWKYDGFQRLLRNLGLEMTDIGFFHGQSTPEERAAVELKLKQSLDAGIPCSLVNMEHQVISGYDDKAFFTAQPWGDCCGGFPPATLTFGTWPEFKDETHVSFFTFRKLAPVAGQTRGLGNTYREIADLLAKAADKEMEPVAKAALLAQAKDREAQAITQVESLLSALS